MKSERRLTAAPIRRWCLIRAEAPRFNLARRQLPQQSALLLYHSKLGTIARDSLAGWSRSNSAAVQAAPLAGGVGEIVGKLFCR